MSSAYKIEIEPRVFHFKSPAGTSRGVYLTRKSWFVSIQHLPTDRKGIGECAPLPNLSCDDIPDYENVLRGHCAQLRQTLGNIDLAEIQNENVDAVLQNLSDFPSMLFGIETALLELKASNGILFDTPFSRGEIGIPINGLVWMGTYDEMASRMQEKLDRGYRCVKLKIGAIDFDKELDLIRRIRADFSADAVQLRVDANGAFSPKDAMSKLESLAQYDIHSIEQPIRQGQWSEMAKLCIASPLPIALDEELIGINSAAQKSQLLDEIRPKYIILKPSLHGGMRGAAEWISLARERRIGSWITSALESNVGLNAIAQFTSHIYGDDIKMPQGLGTGQLFTDNIDMPLSIIGDELWRK